MSAVLVEPSRVDEAYAAEALPARRLTLVPGGAPASERGAAFRRSAPAVRAAPLRITRRGRLICTLVASTLLSLAVLLVLAHLSTPAAPPVDHATTVRAGQSLSEVAAEQLPHVPLTEGVAALRVANDMNSTAVQAGQSLLVPRL